MQPFTLHFSKGDATCELFEAPFMKESHLLLLNVLHEQLNVCTHKRKEWLRINYNSN